MENYFIRSYSGDYKSLTELSSKSYLDGSQIDDLLVILMILFKTIGSNIINRKLFELFRKTL